MAASTWLRKALVGQDRRTDTRTVCTGDAVIDVLSPLPRSAVHVRILDVGTASLKLSVPFFLSPGSLIRIHMSNAAAEAEVRFCVCEGSEFHAGVKVEEIVPKDR
jgi:hypothetical protein